MKNRSYWKCLIYAIVILGCAPVFAAKVYLVNGQHLTGEILSEDKESITLQVGQVKVPLFKNLIVSIEENDGTVRLIEHPKEKPAPSSDRTTTSTPDTQKEIPMSQPAPDEKVLETVEQINPLLPILFPIGNTFRITSSLLNVRKGPSADFDKISALPQDTVVVQSKQEGDWHEIRSPNGINGWVYGKYIEPLQDEYVVCTGERVNLREGPGLNYKILRKINSEEILLLLQQQKEWVQLRDAEGLLGWASGNFIAQISNSSQLKQPYVLLNPDSVRGVFQEERSEVSHSEAETVQLKISDSNWVHGGKLALLFCSPNKLPDQWGNFIQSKDILQKYFLTYNTMESRIGVAPALLGLKEEVSVQLVVLKGIPKEKEWIFEYRQASLRLSGLRRFVFAQKGTARGSIYEF